MAVVKIFAEGFGIMLTPVGAIFLVGFGDGFPKGLPKIAVPQGLAGPRRLRPLLPISRRSLGVKNP
jgi:hypothetical protein